MTRADGAGAIGRSHEDGEAVDVRLTRADLDALDRWIGKQDDPKPSRPEIVLSALRAWLVDHGCLRPAHELPQPSGPATDAIHRMDADIAQDRAKRASRRKGP